MSEWTPGRLLVVDRSSLNMRANDPKWELDQESGDEHYWVALAITEANARRLSLCWNSHDALYEALEAWETAMKLYGPLRVEVNKDGLPASCVVL